ncbi:MAG TPA: hypothetical protein VHC40_01160 [Rhizomicrobium sp.]|jgi:hypothetical protein|nr:hypothetical protein [Rhizomicrobium sp.]
MGYSAAPHDLRSLLGTAIRLRRLAEDPRLADDRALFLMAATALEVRAQRLGAGLAGDRHDRDRAMGLYRSVDITA